MERTVRLIVIAVLATMQGIVGLLRAFEWVRVGIEMGRQGILLVPILGVVAFTWGKLVLVLALGYILFALGALCNQRWAWGLGVGVSLVIWASRRESHAQRGRRSLVAALAHCPGGAGLVSTLPCGASGVQS